MAQNQLVVASEKEHKGRHPGADRTRQRLLQAATEAFTELGFQCATTREIARRAGVNEVTLFRHFRTRSDLLRAVIMESLQAEAAFMAQHQFNEENLRAAVSDYIAAYVDVVQRRETLARIVIGEGHLLPPDVQQSILEFITPVKERIADWLRRGQERGLVRADIDPMGAIEGLRDALQSAVLRWSTFGPRSCSRAIYLKTLTELFVRGLEVRRSGEK
ncbi:MAG: TetR/AcrR family transcriptional regulator [Verrucomicrobia bacterium]|nr:TetR/AcrR family transcriptional regulator [Verrucomicrobiota bacterium]